MMKARKQKAGKTTIWYLVIFKLYLCFRGRESQIHKATINAFKR